MTILICAASGAEARACARGVRDAGLSESFEILETGVGLERARAALARRLASRESERPALVVSAGFAGACSPGLALHAWVTADEVLLFDRGTAVARHSLDPLAFGSGATVCRMVTSPSLVDAAKTFEQATIQSLPGPVSVDMETAALAEVCALEGVPLAVLRMITDTPQRPLPGFLAPFAAAMAETDSRTRVRLGWAGLRGALKDPAGVVRLARDSGAWIDALRKGWKKCALSVRNHCGNARH